MSRFESTTHGSSRSALHAYSIIMRKEYVSIDDFGKERKEKMRQDIDPTTCILFKRDQSCELFEAFERKERERIDETRE